VSDRSAVLAVDIGGSHATCALVRGGEILAWEHIDIADARRLQPVLGGIAGSVNRLRTDAHECRGIAFSFPGIVDPITARVLSTPKDKFADSRDLDLRGWCAHEFGLRAQSRTTRGWRCWENGMPERLPVATTW